MSWRILFSPIAAKQLRKLDRQSQLLIGRYLKRIEQSDSPYDFGKSLVGDKTGIWRYRVGKFRILCDIRETELIVEIITIDKRDKVYRS